jgi:hypothetical protein
MSFNSCLVQTVHAWLKTVLFWFHCFVQQPGKSLYTTVRELVENALDSSESIAELPVIEVTM